MILLLESKHPLHILNRVLCSSFNRVVSTSSLSAPAYKPQNVERYKYEDWVNRDLFKAENVSPNPRFSMVLPPPNITGKLHLGHALACTIQDVIARYKRSTGHNVLWLPGTDHAGIATQGIVEKHIKTRTGIDRNILGRECFIKEVWKWKEKHGDTICNQLQTLGCSLDWSRQVFTMDPKHTHAVNTAFLQLFKKGLIYRKKALVNWCNALQSTVSDIEVENIMINGPTDFAIPGYSKPVTFGRIYKFYYAIKDSDDEVLVTTTMPETMLGDTAIAVHPDDERYKHLRGQRAIHPYRNATIPIIFDDFVDIHFGSGAVKITPAHSKIDYEIATHHNLPLLQVIGEDGRMQNASHFSGMKRYDCRRDIVESLDDMGLLKEVAPHQMTLPICSRTGDVIDYLPKEQWFLSCTRLNESAANLVKNGKLKIEPEKFVQNWLDWTEDDRDWCISRQLWWGHQIPAYRCSADNNTVWVAALDENSARVQASDELKTFPDLIQAERDTDVLDTWFSSGIYPFAAMGWPNCYQNRDYGQFYPLSLMATGHDILGFWVHRMVILGLELTGKLPFDNVLLHGVICDNRGAKMSKSRGNVIDPIDVINGISFEGLRSKSKEMHKNGVLSKTELDRALAYHKANFSNTNGIPECGVDALRFTLLSQNIKSHFVNFDVAMCHANKLFCNKIWQSINYTFLAFGKLKMSECDISKEDLSFFDKWILSRLSDMVEKVNESMETYDFHLTTKAIRNFIYHDFCDVYLEATKPGFDNVHSKTAYAHAHTLSAVLNTSLRCLAPFMIYLTDELIPKIPECEKNVVHTFNDANNDYLDFPSANDFKIWKNIEIEQQMERILSIISIIRQLKGLYKLSNKLEPRVYINTSQMDIMSDINENKPVVMNLTRSSDIIFEKAPTNNIIKTMYGQDTVITIELAGDQAHAAIKLVQNRLKKRIEKLQVAISKAEAKYSSPRYLTSVDEATQNLDNEKLEAKRKELETLKRMLD